jgi:hypothetical protein
MDTIQPRAGAALRILLIAAVLSSALAPGVYMPLPRQPKQQAKKT